jgi:HD-like signal output (HDOD) protein
MWVFLICLLMVIGLLAIIFLVQDRGVKPAISTSVVKKPPPVPREEATRNASSAITGEPRENVADEDGTLIEDPSRPNTADDIQVRVQNGLNLLFSDPAESTHISLLPLRLEHVDPVVKSTVLNRINQLKAFRSSYDLYQSLDDPKMDMSTLSRTIVTDPILSGKVLRVANSAYFGLQRRVNSIGHAMMIIGSLNLKHILYQDGFRPFIRSGKRETELQNHLWEHATLSSICALHIHTLFENVDRGTIFTLGLLHDVGKYVLLGLESDLKKRTKSEIPYRYGMSNREEYEAFGINHALIGRLVFEEWGFSDLMVKIIEKHHDPSAMKMDELQLEKAELQYLLVLFLSDQIAKVFENESGEPPVLLPLDLSYRSLINRDRLMISLLDVSLYGKIQKSRALMRTYLAQ